MKSQLQGGPGTEAIQTREGHFRGRKTLRGCPWLKHKVRTGREGWEGLAQAPHAAGGHGCVSRHCSSLEMEEERGGGKRGGKGRKRT